MNNSTSSRSFPDENSRFHIAPWFARVPCRCRWGRSRGALATGNKKKRHAPQRITKFEMGRCEFRRERALCASLTQSRHASHLIEGASKTQAGRRRIALRRKPSNHYAGIACASSNTGSSWASSTKMRNLYSRAVFVGTFARIPSPPRSPG